MTAVALTRRFGFLREAPGQHDALCGGANRSAGEHFGTASSLPTEALAIVDALSSTKDQGNSSSCVGHGIAHGAEARLRVQGIAVRPCSPRAIYTLSNELLRKSPKDKLTDDGTYARTALQGASSFGVPAETDWPMYEPDGAQNDVTQEVPPDVLQRASSWKVREQFTVTETGAARVATCALYLSRLRPLPCAGDVDTVFGAYTGTGVIPATDPSKVEGGHMVCIVGYRTGPTGKLEFLIQNSWKDWGFSLTTAAGQTITSLAWVSAEWVMQRPEIYAFTLTQGRAA